MEKSEDLETKPKQTEILIEIEKNKPTESTE